MDGQSATRHAAIDQPVRLDHVLSVDDVTELVTSCVAVRRFGITVSDMTGSFDVRSEAGVDSSWARQITECALHQAPGGELSAVSPLVHDGEQLGVVVVGPCTRGTGDEALALARHVCCMLSLILHSAYARYLTGVVHVASMGEALEELEEKNQRLVAAVERMQALDNVKTSFLATVSHELRTPLTSVIGYSEMLLEGLAGELNAEQRDYVETILTKADQLLQLITSILDVSLLEAGAITLARKPVRLSKLIDSVVAGLSGPASRRGITISVPRTAIPRMLGDGPKVRQVLWNVISNAVKFSVDGGRVSINVEVGELTPQAAPGKFGVEPHSREELGVRVVIRDQGIGISEAKQSRIFEPFFQVDSSSTREYGGTGLGLTLAKQYVEAQGGYIWVDSELGTGSRFTVSWPAVPEDLEEYLKAGERSV